MLKALLPTLVLALVALPQVADACSCMFSSPCRTYASADAVFAGDVVEVREGPLDGPTPKVVRLRVARAYKGSAPVGDVVAVAMPGGSSASCSLDVTPGSRVLIYGGVKDGGFTTDLCRGSHSLRPGAPWPDLPPPGGTVSGQLGRRPTEIRAAPRYLPGIPVWIEAAGRRIASTTDADGRFRLTDVPAGKWTLQFDLGPSEVADQDVELRSAEDCAVVYASPRPRTG